MAAANVRAARASCEPPDLTPLLIKQNLAANSANLRGKPGRENRGWGLVRCHESVEGWGGSVMRHINREVPSCAPQRPIAPDGGAAHRTHTAARPSPPGA